MILPTRRTLIDKSLAVIEAGQASEGAYLACPDFPTYRYSWFRDGAFIAEAMDEWDRDESASAFHRWVISTIEQQIRSKSNICAEDAIHPDRLLHTRYQADGVPGTEAWPNFQLDGFGTWLWAFERHLRHIGETPTNEAKRVVSFLADYLALLWPRPNYDCWEEHEDRVHPSTLGAIYTGLKAAAQLLQQPRYLGVAEAVRSYLLAGGVRNGHFTKHIGCEEVDANLLWLTIPYKIVLPEHPISRTTAKKVRRDLLDADGGVHRYRQDTYYGGGSWLLLSAALAQDHLAVGERAEAEHLLEWIEAQATPAGHLPEQTAASLNDPTYLPEWEGRWGKSACPLLWSHASYLSLVKRLEEI